jgi:hypothetical protein
MWVWVLTAVVWALFTVSLAWLLRHRGEPHGSGIGDAGARVRRPVGDNAREGRRWRQRSWWSKTR